MHNISNEEIIENIQKISEIYQEIILNLMQGKGSMIPVPLVDSDKNRVIFTNMTEQFFASPDKFMKVNLEYIEKFKELTTSAVAKFVGSRSNPLFLPANKDKRFNDPAWQDNAYFDFVKQFYLMSSEWLQKNIEQYELLPDLKQHLEFMTRQFIDAFSPSNFVACNPMVLRETLESGGQNLVQGLENLLKDIKNSGDLLNIKITDNSAFKLGQNIAATKGKIVYQNELMQLICYKPKEETYKAPLLIVPPCINKYYILDLSSHNSMISFFIENNFQVFLISWVNPDNALAHKNFEDYLKEGILEATEYILKLGYKKINFVGYCIGGTMLAAMLSYFKQKKLECVNSASFLATLLDFTHPGELGVFINESTISHIEEDMDKKGYFDGRYLSNSFSLLRANDLVWSFFVNNYLLGKAPMPFDLLYWNADPTNLPAKMHSYYLRNMYLDNLLKTPNALTLLDTPMDLSKIDCNSFFVAAKDDHLAPWRSVYEGVKLLSGNKTFCLTNSGHVAGIINPPCAEKYLYRSFENLSLTSESWFINSLEHKGSWWSCWLAWLKNNNQSLTKSINYNDLKFLEEAPGSYVLKNIL